ncbi:MAG: YggU family protein [Dehalococcoidales bacterium]|nr:YggU family protein [Dehalococcoidales bacterium]
MKVTPNAGRNEITGFTEGVLHVKINAPPVKGKANRELIDFLSRALGVKKSAIAIVKGQTSRNKTITVAGMSREDILKNIIP